MLGRALDRGQSKSKRRYKSEEVFRPETLGM
jgi:hypothetical protein